MAKQTIKIGEKAPALALNDETGRKRTLKDLQGKWVVLYFYPKDDTPGCTTEACDFSSAIGKFEGMNAEIVGVSPDDPASHRKFIGKHGIKVRLLSDPEHKTLERYGAWGEKNMYGRKSMGVIRSTVIIDPQGRIAHHWPKVSAKGHAEQVRQKLTELQAAGS